MNDPISMVLAVTVLGFFGGIALGAGLHVGWQLASYVTGPIKVNTTTTQTTFIRDERSSSPR